MTERSTRLPSSFALRPRDPSRSRDPRVRALVRELAQLPAASAPDPQFRAELRTQLVAVAPRLVAEGTRADDSPGRAATQRRPVPRATGGSSVLRRLPGVRVGRPVAAVLGVLCVFAVLLGGAVWISGTAIPGDTLYTVKRATENARLALAGGDTEKAKDYLSFAKTRADEVAKLLGTPSAAALSGGANASGSVSAHTAELVDTTLDSADSDVRDASRLLTGKAVRDRQTAALSVMIEWVPGQLARLQQITTQLPAGAVLDRVQASATLVRAALARAQQLRTDIACSCLASAPRDQLGPVPCHACAPVVPARTAPTTPTPPSSSTAPRQAPPGVPGGTRSSEPAPAQRSGGAQPGSSSANRANTTTSSTPAGAGNAPRTSPGTSAPVQAPGQSESSPRAGTGTTSSPAPAGTAPRTTEPAQPSDPAPSPNPSRTCLIVLLGICI